MAERIDYRSKRKSGFELDEREDRRLEFASIVFHRCVRFIVNLR